MQVKELTKSQFIVTLSASEQLIVEGYSKIFNTTLQAAALIMCVRGWTSYAELMMQYCRSVKVEPVDHATAELLENERKMLYNSNEAQAFRKAMQEVAQTILGDDGG